MDPTMASADLDSWRQKVRGPARSVPHGAAKQQIVDYLVMTLYSDTTPRITFVRPRNLTMVESAHPCAMTYALH